MTESDHIRHCVEVLARTPMDGMSLEEWGVISNTFLQAADRIETLEREVRGLYDDKAHDADAIKAGRDRIEALMAENFALAANQCKHGISGEHGDHVCSRIEALQGTLRNCLSYVDEGWLKERIRAALEGK